MVCGGVCSRAGLTCRSTSPASAKVTPTSTSFVVHCQSSLVFLGARSWDGQALHAGFTCHEDGPSRSAARRRPSALHSQPISLHCMCSCFIKVAPGSPQPERQSPRDHKITRRAFRRYNFPPVTTPVSVGWRREGSLRHGKTSFSPFVKTRPNSGHFQEASIFQR